MDSAANRKTIRRKEKEARLAARQRQEVITSVMSTAAGRQWLWDILSDCHCFHTTFNGDALASTFAEGQRAVGLRLLADLMTACPDQYIQAQREANVRSTTDERRSSAESDGGDSGSIYPDLPGSEDGDRSLDDYDIYRPEEFRTGVPEG